MKTLPQGRFTLIELLVVIAIIGLLSSIVFASFGAYCAQGKKIAAAFANYAASGSHTLKAVDKVLYAHYNGGRYRIPYCG